MPRMPHHRKRTRPELFPSLILPNQSSSVRRLTHNLPNYTTTTPNSKLIVQLNHEFKNRKICIIRISIIF
ncbi:hypothetical protein Hanom_Chr12g01114361 [Helianthus anomalus]